MLNKIAKLLFFGILVKPLVLILLGLNIHNRHKLPLDGPVIIAPNHNSHLDTLVLMSLFPLSKIHKIRPVAAADYFLSNRFIAWFSLAVIGIVPLDRKNISFSQCHSALDNNNILILFPEGTRGQPEQMAGLKRGIYHLVSKRNDTTIIPVVFRGLGQVLPRGEALFVPLNCDVIIGEPLLVSNNAKNTLSLLSDSYLDLQQYCITKTEGNN